MRHLGSRLWGQKPRGTVRKLWSGDRATEGTTTVSDELEGEDPEVVDGTVGDEPTAASDAADGGEDGGDFFDSDFDDDGEPDDEDLWGASERNGEPVDRRIVFGIVGVVAVLVLAFLVFGGGGSDGDGDEQAVKTTTADGQPPADGGTTQVTSQRAPFGAVGITPTTLPPGATPTGCGDWDTAFNFPPKEIKQGVSIWSDFEGWHVRLSGTTVPELSGSVTGQYTPPVQGQTGGDVVVTPDEAGKRLTFTIKPGVEPVGFDFSTGCKQKELTFVLTTTNGAEVAVDQIHLGDRGAVKEYPLVARRTLPVPG
ncbi:MAG: hypothetical protein JWO77_646 [Ilumatobacteraceae bacterium]|nr:hypothetical protein [Ilumatobacteraceae bacterium]